MPNESKYITNSLYQDLKICISFHMYSFFSFSGEGTESYLDTGMSNRTRPNYVTIKTVLNVIKSFKGQSLRTLC